MAARQLMGDPMKTIDQGGGVSYLRWGWTVKLGIGSWFKQRLQHVREMDNVHQVVLFVDDIPRLARRLVRATHSILLHHEAR